VRSQLPIELVEHDAGLDRDPAAFAVERDHAVEMSADIDDQGLAHRLAALRRAGAARQHRHALFGGDFDRTDDVLVRARDDDADRLDLVD